ncbi:MAG TPA: RHS repeat-associated core domain-containing protein [Gemmatimonadaceae bacterium]
MDKPDATGTYYRRNRSYDPTTGRFTQEDPLGLGGGLNVYGFANGDPATSVTRLGSLALHAETARSPTSQAQRRWCRPMLTWARRSAPVVQRSAMPATQLP